MPNRIAGIMLLTLAVLVAIIAFELRSGTRSAENLSSSSSSSETGEPARPQPLRLSLPPLASLTETTARPLFVESRRPPADASAPVETAPVPAGPGPNFTISAIVIANGGRAVLVNHPDTGTVVQVREGEAIAGWRLDEVTPDRAVFRKEGESRSATLRTFGPAPVPAKPPRVAGGAVPAPSGTQQSRSADETERRRLRRSARREPIQAIPPPGQ